MPYAPVILGRRKRDHYLMLESYLGEHRLEYSIVESEGFFSSRLDVCLINEFLVLALYRALFYIVP